MRKTLVAIAIAATLLVGFAAAQQPAASPQSQRTADSPLPPSPIIGGDGTPNYIPVWATRNYLLSSVIYQGASGNIGIGNTSPVVPLDVNGSINTNRSYEIGGATVLGSTLYSVFVGLDAGVHNDPNQGASNTFVGNNAGFTNTTGGVNSFFGAFAGNNNIDGDGNLFAGYGSGWSNTSGSQNSFVGENTGHSNTTGEWNTFVGAIAGYNSSSGINNTFVGYNAGLHNTGGSNNIYVGNPGCASPCAESNTIRIGGDVQFGPQTATYIVGIYGVNVSGIPVQINANGQLGAQTSSLRFKEQVRDMGDSTSALMRLHPVTFMYKSEYEKGDRTLQYGLIAEEVAKVYPELVAYDTAGEPYAVRYQYLSTMLLNEVQKQYRRAEAEAVVVEAQDKKIDELEQRLSRLEALLGSRVNTAAAGTASFAASASR